MSSLPPNVPDFVAINPAIETAFQSSKTSATASPPQASNAHLDEPTLLPIFRESLTPTARLPNPPSCDATSHDFRILYAVDPAAAEPVDQAKRIFVELVQCATAGRAEEKMKEHLAFAQRWEDAKKPSGGVAIGQYALEMGADIFWVRDSVFVDVACDTSADEQTLTRLRTLATKLDAHLARSSVPHSSRTLPNPSLTSPASLNLETGQTATLKLSPVTDTHALKPAEVSDSRVGLVRGNGSEAGEWVFQAMAPGSATVKLVVADKKSLAVVAKEVTVKVVAGKGEKTAVEKLKEALAH